MILVCGEALLDAFVTAETRTGLALDADVGGSPFNVAVGLARLCRSVGFCGAISNDPGGQRLMRALRAEGVATDAVLRLDAPTTLALVGLDARGVASYAFYGAGCADRLLPAEAVARVPSGFAAISFGSYATVTEPTASSLRALVEREHGRALIAFDPNVRLVVEPDIGVWRRHFAWMLGRCDLLKISEEDLGLLQPGADLELFAMRAITEGVSAVVVTRGAQGAVGWTAGGARVSVASVPVEVVDTVGAGDTFQAALLAWLDAHASLDAAALSGLAAPAMTDAMAFAARAAAITCSRRGADMPRLDELA